MPATSHISFFLAAVQDSGIPAAPQLAPQADAITQTAQQATTASGKVSSVISGVSHSAGTWGNYFEALAALFLLLAILWLVVSIVKRRGGKFFAPNSPVMLLEGRLSIAPKKWIILASVEGKRLVLGLTDEHITFLTELPDKSAQSPVQPAEKTTHHGQTFEDVLDETTKVVKTS